MIYTTIEDCIFCKIVAGEIKSWKVFENGQVFAFLDTHPASKYHTIIIPKMHYKNIFDIPKETLEEVIGVVKEIVILYNNKLGLENVQIISSSGSEAQQDVFHFHIHIVPRQKGDGQDIVWKTHSEWTENFDQLLANIQ